MKSKEKRVEKLNECSPLATIRTKQKLLNNVINRVDFIILSTVIKMMKKSVEVNKFRVRMKWNKWMETRQVWMEPMNFKLSLNRKIDYGEYKYYNFLEKLF